MNIHTIAISTMVLCLLAPNMLISSDRRGQYNAPEAISPKDISLRADCGQLFKAAPSELQEFIHLLNADPMPDHLLPRGFILYGPPGTGKTELAKALALTSGFSFYNIETAQFGSPYYNETPANLRSIFEKIKDDLSKEMKRINALENRRDYLQEKIKDIETTRLSTDQFKELRERLTFQKLILAEIKKHYAEAGIKQNQSKAQHHFIDKVTEKATELFYSSHKPYAYALAEYQYLKEQVKELNDAISTEESIQAYDDDLAEILHKLSMLPKSKVGAIVFMDEFESVAQKRTSGQACDVDNARTVTYLLTAIEGLTKIQSPIIVIGATNRLEMIDSAAISRLAPIYVGMPTEENRLKALETLNPQFFKHDFKLSQNELDFIAQQTDGLSYRDLVDITKRCAVTWYLHKDITLEKISEIIATKREILRSQQRTEGDNPYRLSIPSRL